MNSFERIMNRINGKPVDYIPNMGITMMFAAKEAGVSYGKFCSDYRALAEGAIRCYEKYGIDMVCAVSDPMREAEGFGTQVIIPEDSVPYAAVKRVQTAADVATLKVIDPYSGRRMADRIEAVRLMKERVGGDVPVVGWVEGAVAESCDLMGVQEFFLNLFDEPEAMEELLNICMEQSIAFAKAQIQAGADIIGVGDAATSLLGPAMYEEFALPYQQKIIRAIHDMGAKVKLHICGNLNHLFDLLAQTGADIIDLDSMVDMKKAAEVLPRNVCICGNMNPVEVCLFGTEAQVEEATRECIELKAVNNVIIAPGCEIPQNTPEENVLAIHKAILKYS